MKLMSRIFIILLIINGALLYVHYSNSVVADGYDKNALTYSQEIEVQYRERDVVVTHHFTNLAPVAYDITWPKGSEHITCIEDERSTCDRTNEQQTSIVAGDATEQTYRYTLPKRQHDVATVQYNHPFATLSNADVSLTTVHIVDETTSGGMWVTGLEQIGTKLLDEFHYFLFAGVGEVDDLFWQKEATPLAYRGDRVTTYGQTEEEFSKHIDELLDLFKSNHMTVVLHKGEHNVESERFVALPTSQKEEVADLLFTKSIQTAYAIPLEERVVAEVIGSLLLEEPIGSELGKRSYTRLTNTLAADELVRLDTALKEAHEEPLTAKVFDTLIGEVSQSEVNYFTQVVAHEEPNQLLLYEPKSVVIHDEVIEQVKPLKMQGKLHYPIASLMKPFGFETEVNEQSIYVRNGEEEYRFSLIDPFYVYKGKRVNLPNAPYTLVDGQYYFDEPSLLRIFKLIFEHRAEEIDVRSLHEIVQAEVEGSEEE